MKLLILTTGYPRHAGDPAGRFVAELADAMRPLGFEPLVLAPDHAGSAAPASPDSSIHRFQYMLPRRWQRLAYGDGIPENLARRPWLAWQIAPFAAAMWRAAATRARGRDAILSHWLLPCGWIGARIARRAGLTHVAVAHSGDAHMLSRLPGRAGVLRQILAGTHRIAAVSHFVRDRLLQSAAPADRDALAARMTVIPMGVTAADYAAARPLPPEAPFTVLFLGRLAPVKGASVLLEAAAGQPWQLRLGGEGMEREALEARAVRLGVTARFVGRVPPAERAAFFSSGHALAVPSIVLPNGRTEGQPVALGEAMAAGLPVVASAVGGIPEMLRDGYNGLLAPPGDAAAWRAAVAALRDDPALRARLGGKARRSAAERDWPVIAARFAALYMNRLAL